MDFNTIKRKENKRFNSEAFEKYLIEESPSFMDNYSELVDELDFEKVFIYHKTKFLDEIYTRIKVIDKNFPGKKLTNEHLGNEILNFDVQDCHIKQHLKCHLYAFNYFYEMITKQILEHLKEIDISNYYTDNFIRSKMQMLTRLMYDVLEIMPYYEYASGVTPTHQVLVNRHITGHDIAWFYDLYANGTLDQSNQVYYTTFAYLLRQALEIKTKNALGIVNILYNKKPQLITSDHFIEFLLKNDKIKKPDMNIALIEKIFKWCNYHIHLGVNLYVWQALLIQEYIEPLFNGGHTSKVTSIYGSIIINKNYYEQEIKTDLLNYLKQKGYYVDEIKMQERPECILEE